MESKILSNAVSVIRFGPPWLRREAREKPVGIERGRSAKSVSERHTARTGVAARVRPRSPGSRRSHGGTKWMTHKRVGRGFVARSRKPLPTPFLEDAQAGDLGDSGGTGGHVELRQRVRDVPVHRVLADEQPLGDGVVAETDRNEAQDLELSHRQPSSFLAAPRRRWWQLRGRRRLDGGKHVSRAGQLEIGVELRELADRALRLLDGGVYPAKNAKDARQLDT